HLVIGVSWSDVACPFRCTKLRHKNYGSTLPDREFVRPNEFTSITDAFRPPGMSTRSLESANCAKSSEWFAGCLDGHRDEIHPLSIGDCASYNFTNCSLSNRTGITAFAGA